MNECFGKYYILNGVLQPSASFDNALVYEGNSIYEVLRMIRGNPVFFDDHMERLTSSLRYQKKESLAEPQDLKRSICKLVRTEREKNINLKIVFNYNNGTGNYLVYFIEPVYPTPEQYRKGVTGILFHAERKDPESKVINHRLRSSIYHKLITESAYEALLVNEKNEITEGSRSNIFFIKDDVLTTAPDNAVLNGITRKYIIDICRESRIKVEFSCVPADRINEFESVFMTGTSPVVLPFCIVGKDRFNVSHPLIAQLRTTYLEKAMESTVTFRAL